MQWVAADWRVTMFDTHLRRRLCTPADKSQYRHKADLGFLKSVQLNRVQLNMVSLGSLTSLLFIHGIYNCAVGGQDWCVTLFDTHFRRLLCTPADKSQYWHKAYLGSLKSVQLNMVSLESLTSLLFIRKIYNSAMGGQDWRVTMFDTHLRRLLCTPTDKTQYWHKADLGSRKSVQLIMVSLESLTSLLFIHEIYNSAMGDQARRVTMLDTHLRKLRWMYCPGHAGNKGHGRADRLVGNSTITMACVSEDSRQLSVFSLCSPGRISALLILSTVYLFTKISLSPDVILCGWLGLKHRLTN